MKERSSLVSNSSSSSFIFAYRKGVDIPRMVDILGVRPESPLSDMAESIAWTLFRAKKYGTLKEFLDDYDWEDEQLHPLTKAFEEGWTVHAGSASDEDWSNHGEVVLCNLAMDIETDEILLKKESGY